MKHTFYWLALLLAPIALAGCASLSLERHTVNQAMTATELRYQLVLSTLAKVAVNLGDLPGVGTITDGTVSVADSANIDLKTAFDGLKNGFTGEAISGGVNRTPNLQWTIDTAHTPDQLKAIQAACVWAVTGCEPQNPEIIGLLKFFQVYNDLVCLNNEHPGWFGTGCKADVPKGACYHSHEGHLHFWVAPGATRALSDFTLILSDIATISQGSLRGTAVVNLVQWDPTSTSEVAYAADSNKSAPKYIPLTQQSISFVYDDPCSKQIDFLNPVVVFGPPKASQLNVQWQPVPWCNEGPEIATSSGNAALVIHRRPLVTSAHNSTYSFHAQRLQEQAQAQQYLSK